MPTSKLFPWHAKQSANPWKMTVNFWNAGASSTEPEPAPPEQPEQNVASTFGPTNQKITKNFDKLGARTTEHKKILKQSTVLKKPNWAQYVRFPSSYLTQLEQILHEKVQKNSFSTKHHLQSNQPNWTEINSICTKSWIWDYHKIVNSTIKENKFSY